MSLSGPTQAAVFPTPTYLLSLSFSNKYFGAGAILDISQEEEDWDLVYIFVELSFRWGIDM